MVRRISGREITVKLVERRPGDIASCFADATKAREVLGWTAKLGPQEMVRDAWNWTEKNPEGVKTKL
jgi:UDP-glucose 4-epimerase